MKKIYFDESTYIWKTKLNLTEFKQQIIDESSQVIESLKDKVIHDGFGYKNENQNINFIGDVEINNKLDEIFQSGINACKDLYTESNKNTFNRIYSDSWINVVRSKDPIQIQFKHDELRGVDKYHNHVDINKEMKSFRPDYTFVYYIQMPDVMNDEDGVLYFKGKNKKEYWIRPEEDDLIIMEADMPHAPNNAPNSTIDRIVLAGNVGFEFIKKEKSLI
jgi:hypothetical protein